MTNNFFDVLYEVKKVQLMLECLNGNMDLVSRVYEDVRAKVAECREAQELVELVVLFYEMLRGYISRKQFEEWDGADYECYTERMYHRAFWNEIANHASIDEFIEKACELLRCDFNDDCYAYEVRLYDFNDCALGFHSKEEATAFINRTDCLSYGGPFTLFELKGSFYIEKYSA